MLEPIRLRTPPGSATTLSAGVLDGICYGLIVGMTIYALMMFLMFRNRVYACFMLAMTAPDGALRIARARRSRWLLRVCCR